MAIRVESNTVEAGSSFIVSGSNFKPHQKAFIELEFRGSDYNRGVQISCEADENGLLYSKAITIPEDVVPGDYEVEIFTGTNYDNRELIATLPIRIQAVTEVTKLTPPPGKAHFSEARIYYDDSVELKVGETKLLDVALETREDGPGEVIYEIFRVTKEYAEDELPLPEGLSVSIEPSKFMAYPDNTYHSTITIRTNDKLAPGEYFLLFERNFENVFWQKGWIRVNVE